MAMKRRRRPADTDLKLSVKQRDDIANVFKLYDVNGEGKMEARNLKLAMRALGFEPKAEEVKSILSEMQFSEGDKISVREFTEMMESKILESDCRNEIMKAFALFIRGETGKITLDDLKRVATDLGESISDQELREMIEEADTNKDGAVDLEEFYKVMKRTNLY